MKNSPPHPLKWSIWKTLIALTAVTIAGTHAKAQEPETLIIRAVLDFHLNFTLEVPDSITDVSFASTPGGISFDPSTLLISGAPTNAGFLDTQISFKDAGQAASMPARFEVYTENEFAGDPNNPNADSGEHEGPPTSSTEPIRIFGAVGQPLFFQIPHDISAGADFAPKADGTSHTLPAGIQFNPDQGGFTGVPQIPGVFDFALLIMGTEGMFTEHFVFDIASESGHSGDGDEPKHIIGVVDFALFYPLEIPAEITILNFSPLPSGLSFDSQQIAIVGTPDTAGFLDSKITFEEAGATKEKRVTFDIIEEADFTGDPNNPNPPQDHHNPEHHEHPFNVFGDVGFELFFPLNLGDEVTDLTFDQLPEGLTFDEQARTIQGTPLYPMFFETYLRGTRDEQEVIYPVYFDIFGDYGPGSGDGGFGQELKVHGWVGEFISFPLPMDPFSGQETVSLTIYDDGTEAFLPLGIQLDPENGMLVGFPQEPGFFESSLTLFKGEETEEIRVFFDIQYLGQDPNDHPYPDGPDYHEGPEEITLFSEVGARFSFKFPLNEEETAKLPTEFDGMQFELPAGLTFNEENYSITGAPTDSGIFETLVFVESPTHTKEIIIRFLVSDASDAPRLSFYTESEYEPGVSFSYQFKSSNSPTSFEVIGLPGELQLDSSTGTISGTIDYHEDFDLLVKASNEDGDAYSIHFLDSEYDDHESPDEPHKPDGEPHEEEEEEDPEPFFTRLGVPFELQAPSEFDGATFALVDGESFPSGLGFGTEGEPTIHGTPAEAGLFSTKISITNGEDNKIFRLWFLVADSVEAPQFVSRDYIQSRPGSPFELGLPLANAPATISIVTGPDGVSYDNESKSLRGILSEPGFYVVLLKAVNDSGTGVHAVEIDVFDDGTGHNPADDYYEPIHAFGIVGEPFDFPLPANPHNSEIQFVDGEDGTPSEIPVGLDFIDTYAIIRGIPEKEGISSLFMEITEFGFTRREQIVFEIYTHDTIPDNPDFPKDPAYEEPDDGHVEPILGKVGERLFFEAPISGENVSFQLVDGPDGDPSELPPGVNFDAELGIISGVPTASGIYPLWVKVDEFGSVRTHFAPVIISGVEGSPVITSDEFFTTIPGEHFKFEITASNDPDSVEVDFFDVPGVLSFDPNSMLLEGKFDFGGFFTLLVSATNDSGTGYGLLNIDVLGINHDGGPMEGPNEIPLHINGTVDQEIDYELPSFIRGSKFVVSTDPGGFQTQLPRGLSIDEKTGRISGTPTQPGFTFIWVEVDEGDLPALAVNIGIAQGMRTPEIVSPEFWLGHQDSHFHYQIHATDGPFEYFASGLPSGLALDATTGTIRGNPTQSGDFEVALSASNAAGTGQERILFLFIEEKPRLPVVSAPFYTEGQVSSALSLQVNATESPDSFQAFGLPAGLSIDSSTGLISGTPVSPGYFDVHVEATNQFGHGSVRLAIYIKRAAFAPVYVGPNIVGGKVGNSFNFAPPVNGDANDYSIDLASPNTLPAGLAIHPETGVISGTPTETVKGIVDILISGPGGSTIASVFFKIAPALDAPVIDSSPFARGTTGQSFTFQISATNNPLEFVAENLPTGLSINSSTGLISGTPASAGFYDILVLARNASGWSQPRLVIVDVIPGLAAPTITSQPWAKGEVGEAFSYQIAANNQPTEFLVSEDLPEGLSLNSTTGLISGTPTKAGFAEFVISASNASGQGNGMVFIISIRPSQAMPVVTSSGTAFAKVGDPFVYQIRATASPTSYSAENLPDGLSLNESSGFISGTPTSPTDEPILIVVTASNAAGESLPRAVLLEVLPSAEAPVILSGGHAIAKVGVDFQFQIWATNEPTAYSSPNLPEGLSLASDTGLITGSPVKAGEFAVTLNASNDAGTGDPASLLLFILPGAEMPRVTSAPHALGKVGEEFSYQITASAENLSGYLVDGDLPRGLDFDPTTGLISGSPVEPIITSVYLAVSNDAGTSAPQPLTIKIQPSLEAPVITSSLRIAGTVGEELSYTVAATNMPEERPLPPSAEFDAVGLPSGLGINSATGIISGVPEEAGLYIATILATNESGEGAPRFLSIKVKAAPTAPVVTSVFRVGAQVGTTFNYQIAATNSPTSYDADHAISWLVADTETGSLTGTPTKPGVYYASLFATNDTGVSDPGPLEITVYPAANTPKVTSDRTVDGKVGVAFSYQIEGSNTPTSYAVSGLPAGLTLDAGTGEITGTPTASGTFEVIAVGSNANGVGANAIIVFKISPKTEITIIVPGS